MKILFLAHRIPYPPNKGDKIRSCHILEHLAKKGSVHLGTLIDDPRDSRYLPEMNKRCAGVHASRLWPGYKKLFSVTGHIRGIPASVCYFHDRSLQSWVNHILSTRRIELIFCFSSTMAEYLFCSPFRNKIKKRGIKLIMDFCDVDSRKWLDYAKIRSWPLATFFRREGKLLQRYEQRIADFFDVCYLSSSRELSIFNEMYHGGNIKILENGVDLEFFSNRSQQEKKPKGAPVLAFTGAMNYDVNIDGVRWFVQEIWPRIRKIRPDGQFFIVGSNPVAVIRKLNGQQGIVVTGFVHDIRKYYQLADICVAPLRIARGIQNKVLESLAMSRSTVCTSNALEGISAQPGRDLIVADHPEHFAAEVLRLLDNRQLRQQLGTNGRQHMEQHYSWQRRLAVLDQDLCWTC